MSFNDYAIKVSDYRRKATPANKIDEALEVLAANKRAWAHRATLDRVHMLKALMDELTMIADSWVQASLKAKDCYTTGAIGQEWFGGPYCIQRNLSLLRKSLLEIHAGGHPSVPALRTDKDDRLIAQVFPTGFYDRLFFMGTTAEVWMQPEVTRENLAENMAGAYSHDPGDGQIALVLGAGNVSSIGPMDCLYKLFVEKKVVILKMHPVNAYLGALLEFAFRPLIKQGYLKIVYGDAQEGAYLCNHPAVDEIHITGSDKTHDMIVFGKETEQRKAARNPLLRKPITSELGNVSPVIIAPGPWTEDDLGFHAENIVSSLVNNAGFNCNASRVLITHAEWPQRETLLDEVRAQLKTVACRNAYYPGAANRFDAFHQAHPEAELFGERAGKILPWMFIPGLDPGHKDDICYNTEAFCGLFGETPISASSPSEFMEKATAFANDTLWGTLNATVITHPNTRKDCSQAMEDAVTALRYGTVSINHWAAIGYAMGTTTWGAYPGHDIYDIQSGLDVVHNTLMFEKPEKSVVSSPFRVKPKPAWFITHRKAHLIGKKLSNFEARPSLFKLPGIFAGALTG